MPDVNDMELLREYDRSSSEEAFAALVQRHINLVYSAALRHVGIAAHAEEVTQAVFILLARKASGLRPDTILEGWLYETTRLTALSFLRGERRRQFREQEAYMQSTLQEPTEASTWNQLSPWLDEAMSRLGKKDRDAVLLRFFREKNVREVAATLQVNEAAAQRRILRALEKLRKFFTKRGVSSTTAIIAGAISANSVQAAPTALAKSVTTVAIAKGAAASGSTLTLIKGALKIMAWTKAKTAAAVGVGIILAAGTTTITIKEIEAHKTYDWQVPEVNVMILNTAQPQVRVVTTKFPKFGGSMSDGNRFIGIAATITNLITCAYSNSTPARTIFPAELPQGRYDFIANFPVGSAEALNQEIKKKFGVVGRFETRDAEVWLLKIKRANAPGLKSTLGQGRNNWMGVGHYEGQNQPMTSVASVLEGYFGIPVIDETGMNGRFDIELLWDEQSPRQNPDGLKEALLDELGLELVPSREPIEMLIVEKAP